MLIAVNATAATEGGALSILRRFLALARQRTESYIVFSSSKELCYQETGGNILFIYVPVKSFFRRIVWDFGGLAFWLYTRRVMPDVVLSLQNTPSNFLGKIRQVIYLHQPLPISDAKWSLFKKRERRLWFYKYVYPWFMRRGVDSAACFVCQGEWMVEKYARLLRIAEVRFIVSKPTLDLMPSIKSTADIGLRDFLFYPAASYPYKNHIVLLDALEVLRKNIDADHFANIKVAFTVLRNDSRYLCEEIQRRGLGDNVIFLGPLSFEGVCDCYAASRAVVFPSLIETFGLPLAEAAGFGKAVLCSDLPYAREVLGEYDGACFVGHSPEEWADAIFEIYSRDAIVYEPFRSSDGDEGWVKFFNVVCKGCER